MYLFPHWSGTRLLQVLTYNPFFPRVLFVWSVPHFLILSQSKNGKTREALTLGAAAQNLQTDGPWCRAQRCVSCLGFPAGTHDIGQEGTLRHMQINGTLTRLGLNQNVTFHSNLEGCKSPETLPDSNLDPFKVKLWVKGK